MEQRLKPRRASARRAVAGTTPEGSRECLTDAHLCIMPAWDGGLERVDNAQVVVRVGTILVVGQHVPQSPNDKQGEG